METDIIIRKVTEKDIPGLVKLYEEVWPDVTYNKWEKANFVVVESDGINYCAEKNGDIVGSRTSFYLNFFFGSQRIKCIQVGDSCSRKDCRGKGLFGSMNKALLKDFFSEEIGGQLIWNISVPASKSVYQKLGWNYIESLQTIIKFARPFHIITKVGLNLKCLSGDVEWDMKNDTPVIPSCFLAAREAQMRKGHTLHVNYDEYTFLWRLKSKSGIKLFNVEDLGCVVYKIGQKKGLKFVMIGDVFLAEYNTTNFVKLIDLFQKSLNPDIIKSSISIAHPLYSFYLKSGFRKLHFVNHGVRVDSAEMRDICYNPSNWAISMLDVDTF